MQLDAARQHVLHVRRLAADVSRLQAHARKWTARQRATASLYPACHYNLAPTLRANLVCLVVFSAAAHA